MKRSVWNVALSGLKCHSTVFFMAIALSGSACAHERIFDVHANVEITRDALIEVLSSSEEVIVGEKHDTASIQNAEAKLFSDYARVRKERITLAWEFWNWSEKAALDSAYAKFQRDKITGQEFMNGVFGGKNSEPTYVRLIEAAKAAGADVLATNLTREEKATVTRGGLGALNPSLLPPGFELGDANYLERFTAAMGGHGAPAISNYFAAQSLVDDVAAMHVARDRSTLSVFLVIGCFHTRYFGGVWQRMVKRSPGKSLTLIEIADSGDETDWETIMHDPKYGAVADYLILE
ncbi:MAG: ChaN family lipoprotein [Cryobacterium sp.]|nr:ChaN family lipoprotein [Oligoflexia bacterium]